MPSTPLYEASRQSPTPFLRTRLKLLADSIAPDSDATLGSLRSIGNLPHPRSLLNFMTMIDEDEKYKSSRSASPTSEDEMAVVGRRKKARRSKQGSPSPSFLPVENQSVFLLDLPTELLEQIATYVRYLPLSSFADLPIPPSSYETFNALDSCLEDPRQFLSHRYSAFSRTRFSLSSFSRTCKALRPIVERLLYRDVTLDFQGWAGRKHTRYPAASLKLLLRTLQDRPRLNDHIAYVYIDYFSQSGEKAKVVEQGLTQFLQHLPNLTTLVISPCPVELWSIPGLDNIKTFGTMYAPGILPTLLDHFPNLRHLHLQGNIPMTFIDNRLISTWTPKHVMSALSISSDNADTVTHFMHILQVCGNTVESLNFNFMGSMSRPSPLLPYIGDGSSSGFPRTNLQKLRIDNISILSRTDTSFTSILQSMTSLTELHISHHNPLAENAFSYLPPKLKKLVITEYFARWEQPEEWERDFREIKFGEALGKCILFAPERVGLKNLTVHVKSMDVSDVRVLAEMTEEDGEVTSTLWRDCQNKGVDYMLVTGKTRPAVEITFDPVTEENQIAG